MGEPLTLEDLSVSAHSQSQAHSCFLCSADHWLLDSIPHLEPETTCSGSPTSQEYPAPTQRGPHTGGSQSTPAQPWPSLLETLGVQARLSESPVIKPLLYEATMGTLAGDFSDSDQEILSTPHLGAREKSFPSLHTTRGTDGTSVLQARQGTGRPDSNLQSSSVSCLGRKEERRPHRKKQAGMGRGWPPAHQIQPQLRELGR